MDLSCDHVMEETAGCLMSASIFYLTQTGKPTQCPKDRSARRIFWIVDFVMDVIARTLVAQVRIIMRTCKAQSR